MHPIGVFYDKANEGAGYNGTSGNDTAGNAVMPNQTFLYRWTVPEAVAPTDEDPPCITWMYYSSVDSTKDVHSGRYRMVWDIDYNSTSKSDFLKDEQNIKFLILLV